MVVLAEPSTSSASSPSNSVGLPSITVASISGGAPAQFTSLQPVTVGPLTPSERPLTLDNSILTVTFDAVSGSAMLHNRPPELTAETAGAAVAGTPASVGAVAGAGGAPSVAHFINLTTFVNPISHQLEQPALTWRPVTPAEGQHIATAGALDAGQTDSQGAPVPAQAGAGTVQQLTQQQQVVVEQAQQIQVQASGPPQQQQATAPQQMFSY